MNYSKMKIGELRELAGEKGLRNIDDLKKSELIELLANVDLMMSKSAEKTEKPAENDKNTADKTEKTAENDKNTADKNEKTAENDKNTTDKNEKTAEEKKKSSERNKKTAKNVRTAKKQETAGNSDKSDGIVKSDNNNTGNAQSRGRSSKSVDNKAEKTAATIEKKPSSMAGDNKQNNAETATAENNKQSDTAAAPEERETRKEAPAAMQYDGQDYNPALASGEVAFGILEVLSEGYGFIRSDNYMPGDKDIYISPAQIRRFGLRTGDIIKGPIRARMNQNEKFRALLYIESVNAMSPSQICRRPHFEDMTPIFPNERIRLDYNNAPVSLRIVDLFSPIGKGQRGMIVSPPKAGKTTLLKQIAKRISVAYPEMNLLVLLIDERPEEVTDIKESIEGPNAEVIYSTFDELPEHHKRVSEMVIERAKRLVESKKDVVILIDSITRLSRAYNLTVSPSGRTLSGGLDPAALHMPKKFFGAARNMREGGSLTILATALIDTGSRMDDVVFEEFKGTGNMELVLDRNLSEKRVFPAIDIAKSGTRKDDLLLTQEEIDVLDSIHSQLRGMKAEEITEEIIKIFAKTRNNREFLEYCKKIFTRR